MHARTQMLVRSAEHSVGLAQQQSDDISHQPLAGNGNSAASAPAPAPPAESIAAAAAAALDSGMKGSLLHEAEQIQRRAIQTLELAQVRGGGGEGRPKVKPGWM